MKKYLKTALSFMIVLAIIFGSDAVMLNNTKPEIAEKRTTAISGKASEQKEEAVTVNSENAAELCDGNDTFYEPKEESITVVNAKAAYINDAVTVFFNEGVSDEEKQAVIDSVNGEIVGESEVMNQYEIKIQHSELEEITTLCDELMENESVEFATCTLMSNVEPESVPDDPWNGSAEWGDGALNHYYSTSNWWISSLPPKTSCSASRAAN